MTETVHRLQELFSKFTLGSLTESETLEFFKLIEDYPHLISKLGKETLSKDFPLQHSLSSQSKDLILETIFAVARNHSDGRSLAEREARFGVHTRNKWWWAAASVVILAIITFFLIKPDAQERQTVKNEPASEEIHAGIDGAILTLADGKQVLLDSIENGIISLAGNSSAEVVDGVLLYESIKGGADGKSKGAGYNTITTPNGRQFHLKLSDGTAVWLNAASSVRYPSFFSGNKREVEVTGEVYFEVAENPRIPFRVSINKQVEIEVLGTNFNVKAFETENSISATLLDGRIRIKKTGKDARNSHYSDLRPGQQAQINTATDQSSEVKILSEVDLPQVMAWKNGLFNFENASIEEIMQQFERWYDIKVKFENGVPDIALSGKLNRGVSLNELLPALNKMGLNYILEGRELIIKK